MEYVVQLSHRIAVEIMTKKASEAAQLFRFRLYCFNGNVDVVVYQMP